MLSLVIAGDLLLIEEQRDFMRLLDYFEDALDAGVIILNTLFVFGWP
jgi:hypothetical protein